MTSTRSDGISDMYLYEMPIMTRQNVCKILMKLKVWKELAFHMGYNLTDIREIKYATRQTNDMEAEELLSRWGEQNHTVTELFVLLLRIRQYQAMSIMKNLVDKRYHKFIPQSHLDVNFECLISQDVDRDHLNDNEEARVDAIVPKIEYNDLCDATVNWNHELVLGRGGFGTVYKGTWKRTPVAIKRIDNHFDEKSNRTQMKRNLNELRHLNSCRHDNILPLYGYCVNGGELYLVSQLLLGGSLEQRLFERPSTIPALSWRQRINIAIGTARGLQFLHTFKDKKPLIHGDIKPANIFLDLYNQPKIGDFGLAKEGICGDEAMEVSKVSGTRPYLPKEFILYHILSIKVDSYSFGIVLFQLATGLRAFEKLAYKYLVDYIQRRSVLGALPELIDQTPEDPSDAQEIFDIIIDLGKKCTLTKLEDRLDMVQAYEILEDTFMFGKKDFTIFKLMHC